MTQDETRELREFFETRFNALEARFDKRFDAVDRRFDGVDQRFDALDVRLEHEFGAITEHFVEQRRYIEEVYERLGTRMTIEFEKMRGDVRVITERA